MIKRLILIILTLLGIGATWIVCIGTVIVLIFTKRHPDRCMADYYNKIAPEIVEFKCN